MLDQVIQVIRIHAFHCIAGQGGVLHCILHDIHFPAVSLAGNVVDKNYKDDNQGDENEDRRDIFFVDSHSVPSFARVFYNRIITWS